MRKVIEEFRLTLRLISYTTRWAYGKKREVEQSRKTGEEKQTTFSFNPNKFAVYVLRQLKIMGFKGLRVKIVCLIHMNVFPDQQRGKC